MACNVPPVMPSKGWGHLLPDSNLAQRLAHRKQPRLALDGRNSPAVGHSVGGGKY
jgi:hypothetical protein